MTKLFRFTLDDQGIYAAVNQQIPMDSPLRDHKPDGSWLPKVGEKYPGAISFWTEAGLKKYKESGLRDWHFSVTSGEAKMLICSLQENSKILYEDEFQVIGKEEDFNIDKIYPFTYEGPRPSLIPPNEDRHPAIAHFSSLMDYFSYAPYSGSNESFSYGASYKDLGLVNLGIHYEILPPKKRSSWPHAHKAEEELVYILQGEVEVWINGKTTKAFKDDVIFFPPGTNLAHTIINMSDGDAVMLVIGEQDTPGDLIYYPEHPARNKECEKLNWLWKDRPEPPKYNGIKSLNEFEEKTWGGPDEPLHYYTVGKDLGRGLGASRVALHHQVLKPGYRTGIPHAESCEEEFFFVLKGRPIAWLNGRRYQMGPRDACALPPETGMLHTFINETDEEVEYLLVGETWKDDNQCIYGINPELWEPDKALHWHDWPEQDLGEESSIPGK